MLVQGPEVIKELTNKSRQIRLIDFTADPNN